MPGDESELPVWGTAVPDATTPRYPPPRMDDDEPDAGWPAQAADAVPVAAHRSADRSLLYPSLIKSVVGGLVAIAVILSGIVAINIFTKDDDPQLAPVKAGSQRAGSASPSGSKSASATASDTAAATEQAASTAAAAKPSPAAKPAKPAAKPSAAAPAKPAPSAPAAQPPSSPAAAKVRVPVFVLNSSRIRDLAKAAGGDFQAAGWTVTGYGNTSYRARITTVYYLPGQEAAARQLMRDVPGVRRMLLRPRTLPGSGLTVVVTREYAAD